jgi:hypothetical protein
MVGRHMIYNQSRLLVYDHIEILALGNLLLNIADSRSTRSHEGDK